MKYRVTFETVSPQHLVHYSNADPMTHSNTTQTVPNSEIPNEHWHEVSREGPDLAGVEDQYRTLKAWADADEQFVRNPRLEQTTNEPTWAEVELDG